jgi:hypothetical protein
MVVVFSIVFCGLLFGFVVYRRKKQLRLINDLKNSILIRELLNNGYNQVDKNRIAGIHEGYKIGLYWREDPKSSLKVYATIDCNIPFVKTKGGVTKMVEFSKRYKSSGYAIDSKMSFIKEMNLDYILRVTYVDINDLFSEMVAIAKKEGFDPV